MVKQKIINMHEQESLTEILRRLQRLEKNLDELILDIIDMINEEELKDPEEEAE